MFENDTLGRRFKDQETRAKNMSIRAEDSWMASPGWSLAEANSLTSPQAAPVAAHSTKLLRLQCHLNVTLENHEQSAITGSA